MKKKSILIFMMLFIFMLSSIAFAEEGAAKDIAGIIGGEPTATPPTGMDGTVSGFLGTFQFIGYAVAIGMLIYIGIKYTMAAADAKADMKTTAIRYVIGAILIAGADAIFGWIINMV